MKLVEMLRLDGASIRSGGATVRMFPETPPTDNRPGWMIDQENWQKDAQNIAGYWQTLGDAMKRGLDNERQNGAYAD